VASEGDFYFIAGTPVNVRDRTEAVSPSLRKPDMLPPQELRAALVTVVKDNLGADRGKAITAVSRAVRFRATSTQLRTIIDEQIAILVRSGELSDAAGRLT
jgi:hypothetical protein